MHSMVSKNAYVEAPALQHTLQNIGLVDVIVEGNDDRVIGIYSGKQIFWRCWR